MQNHRTLSQRPQVTLCNFRRRLGGEGGGGGGGEEGVGGEGGEGGGGGGGQSGQACKMDI